MNEFVALVQEERFERGMFGSRTVPLIYAFLIDGLREMYDPLF